MNISGSFTGERTLGSLIAIEIVLGFIGEHTLDIKCSNGNGFITKKAGYINIR